MGTKSPRARLDLARTEVELDGYMQTLSQQLAAALFGTRKLLAERCQRQPQVQAHTRNRRRLVAHPYQPSRGKSEMTLTKRLSDRTTVTASVSDRGLEIDWDPWIPPNKITAVELATYRLWRDTEVVPALCAGLGIPVSETMVVEI